MVCCLSHGSNVWVTRSVLFWFWQRSAPGRRRLSDWLFWRRRRQNNQSECRRHLHKMNQSMALWHFAQRSADTKIRHIRKWIAYKVNIGWDCFVQPAGCKAVTSPILSFGSPKTGMEQQKQNSYSSQWNTPAPYFKPKKDSIFNWFGEVQIMM